MKTYLDCIPCFFKQALGASRLALASEATQKRILDRLAKAILKFSLKSSPPLMGRTVYQIVTVETKNKDPFYGVKQKSNKLALKLYPKLKKKVALAKDKLFVAVELAIAGNIIDFGLKNSSEVEKEIGCFFRGNFNIHHKQKKGIFSYQRFKKDIKTAKTILYIGDNAGEVVFDRVLIEEIKRSWPDKQIFYAVRGKPIINDALIEDAKVCGIDKTAKIVSSGSDAPGIIFKFCTPSFLKLFKKSDLIISKGQGNYETLSEERRPICFLFRAKCPVAARDVGAQLGDVILKYR